MSIIKITEVFIGHINNRLERSLQNLMAPAFNGQSTSLKYVSAQQGDTRSALKEREGLSQTQPFEKDALCSQMEIDIRLFLSFARFETTRMKLSL